MKALRLDIDMNAKEVVFYLEMVWCQDRGKPRGHGAPDAKSISKTVILPNNAHRNISAIIMRDGG